MRGAPEEEVHFRQMRVYLREGAEGESTAACVGTWLAGQIALFMCVGRWGRGWWKEASWRENHKGPRGPAVEGGLCGDGKNNPDNAPWEFWEEITFGWDVFFQGNLYEWHFRSGQASLLGREKKRRARIYLGTRDSSGHSIEEGSPAGRKEPDWWQRSEIRQETVEGFEGRSVKELWYYSTGQLRANLNLDKQKTVA